MVLAKEVQASNALINDETAPRIVLFVGGTSGIGKATVEALVATGTSMRIYLVGRSSSDVRVRAFINQMSTINSKAEIVWTEGEVALLSESKRICDLIKTKEARMDLLFFSTGYAPFGSRNETAEGIEITQSLEYYTRMLFIQCLLPLLNKAGASRVVSVLAGGLEKSNINLDDLDLRKPENFGLVKAQMQYGTMNTVTMEMLADQNPNVTFIHSWPGWVNTGNVRRGLNPDSLMAWIVWLVLEPMISFFGFSHELSGQMHLFQCTSAAFGGRGIRWTGKSGVNSYGSEVNGLFLVNYKCDCTPNSKVMPTLRQKAKEKVWQHTQTVLQPYL